jgi:hypothetical protein
MIVPASSPLVHDAPIRSVFDAHPLPWHRGEENASSVQIRDAEGKYVATVSISRNAGHRGVAQQILDAANALARP